MIICFSENFFGEIIFFCNLFRNRKLNYMLSMIQFKLYLVFILAMMLYMLSVWNQPVISRNF